MEHNLTLADIASLVKGELVGDGSFSISAVTAIEDVTPGSLCALDKPHLVKHLEQCAGAAVLINRRLDVKPDLPHVLVEHAGAALNTVVEHLGLERPGLDPGIHETAVIHPEAEVGVDCRLGPYAVIGKGARVGARCEIHAHAVIEAGAVVGDECHIHPHAVICTPARLGNRVTIWPAAVVGSEGFSFDVGPAGLTRLHHIGTCEVGDGAELGVGVTIDRARFGKTQIGANTKMDNQVHVGHNVKIGNNNLMAAQTGVAGSTEIGNGCMIGGQAGFRDHVKVGDGVQIAAKAGIGQDFMEPGQYMGYWAKPRAQAMRELVAVSKLPEAMKEMKAMRAELEALKAQLRATQGS